MRIGLIVVISTMVFTVASAQEKQSPEGYPDGVTEVSYVSSADDSEQPALFWKPENADGPVPLLVALHTWSSDYRQTGGEVVYARWCQQVNWAFVHPNFRGPNRTPDAMGSDLALQDVLSSIEFAKSQADIDANRIYCIGVSGGGHMSLLMAGRAPEVWAGVSAWCGISDIAAWHEQCSANERFGRYAEHIEKVLGGSPVPGSDRLESARHRSPVTWLRAASGVNLDINAGIHDGRSGSVPFKHSLYAWDAVVPESDRLSEEWIEKAYQDQGFPSENNEAASDDLYGTHQPRFRKTSGNTRVTIFEGGHEIVHVAALNWLSAQRKGQPAVWTVEKSVNLKTEAKETESGK